MKNLKRLLLYIFKYNKSIIIILIFSIISTVLNLVVPIFIGKVIDDIVLLEYSKILQNIRLLLIMYLIIFLSDSLLVKLINEMDYYVSKKIREELFCKITTVNLKVIDSSMYGDIVNKFSVDITNVSNIISGSFLKIISGIITIIIAIIIMFRLNYIMAIAVILSAPIIFATSKFITTKTNRLFKIKAKEMGNINGLADELIASQKVIKDFSYEERALNRFKIRNKKLHDTSVNAQFFSSLINPTTRYISHISYIVIGILRYNSYKIKQIVYRKYFYVFTLYKYIF